MSHLLTDFNAISNKVMKNFLSFAVLPSILPPETFLLRVSLASFTQIGLLFLSLAPRANGGELKAVTPGTE